MSRENKKTGDFETIRNFCTQVEVTEALRAINYEMFERGVTRSQMKTWSETACWFPALAQDTHPLNDYIYRLRSNFDYFDYDTVWVQILLQFSIKPGQVESDRNYHIDQRPPGFRFSKILGIALTRSDEHHGGIEFQDKEDGDYMPHLNPGDAVIFDNDTWHRSRVNHSGVVRYAVYFRFLKAV